MHSTALVVAAVIVALGFDFTNGFHDTANAIATSVSTHALSPRNAVILSSVMNFVGAFVTLKVAATIGSGNSFTVPFWVIICSASAMALGTYAGGWRIIKTMGTRLYKIEPAQGFVAQTVAATVIQVASHFGYPVSTTHVVSGSILGAGSSRSFSAVRWGVGLNIFLAWLITLPMAALFAALTYFVLHFFGK
jgi:phosphate/sulfate permease